MSEAQCYPVGSDPCDHHRSEEPMLQEETVQAVLARLARGERIKTIARELGVDRKTIKRWRRLGRWRPRQGRARPRGVAPYLEQLAQRGPEVGWNAVVLHRELQGLGFTGGVQQVRRAIRPWRAEAHWAAVATVRYEMGPGEQAQVDFGQLHVWIGAQRERVHLFVMTLGYSRRLWVRAYPHERLGALLDGHEGAFRHFGGVPLTCLYDNPRTLVLGRREREVHWQPVFQDFVRYYGVTPRACQPYRARTKGKVESGVKYVKRNALAGRRFASWDALNAWLEEWMVTVADQRIHGTTHERPIERFARETLTPLGARAPYHYARERVRRVPADGLVAIGAARYSVPVQYVGTTVTVQETATHYDIFQGAVCIARHLKAPRHTVVMEPAHYQGLLRPGGSAPAVGPPLWDPAYQSVGEVMVRDLARYAAVAESGGGA